MQTGQVSPLSKLKITFVVFPSLKTSLRTNDIPFRVVQIEIIFFKNVILTLSFLFALES